MALSFFLWVETFLEGKTLYISLQPWYLLTKNLNSSWWNYFYSFLASNFQGLLFYQDFSSFINFLYDARFARYCRFDLISPALVVGYNNIHPPFFYVFLWAILTIAGEDRFFRVKPLLFVGLIIFYWGSLWGVGNAAWGYFWVKDAIELMLLIAIIFLVVYLHLPSAIRSFYYLCVVWFLIAVILLLLRWGFLFTRHSFFNLLATVNFSKFYFIFIFRLLIPTVLAIIVTLANITFLTVAYYIAYCTLILKFSKTSFKSFLSFHMILVIIGLSWLKYQPHNFTVYNTFQKFNSFFTQITAYCVTNGFTLIHFATYAVKRFAIFMTTHAYSAKIISLNLYVYVNWSRFFVVIVFLYTLISTRKIYR